MTVELDEDFLFALYEFSKFENASWQEPVHEYVDILPNTLSESLLM
jgi:vacuolar protein sorting-associated protein 13A/C